MINRRIFFGLPLLAVPAAAPAESDTIPHLMQSIEYRPPRRIDITPISITFPDGASFVFDAPAEVAAKLLRKGGR